MQTEDPQKPCNPEATAAFWINRASKLILRRADSRLRRFGLAVSYLPVLRALSDGASVPQKELARVACVEQPSMAETLTRMERDGVVLRVPNPDDKRGTLVSMTPRARAGFSKAMTALAEGEREATAGFSEAERGTLRALLQRVVKNLETGAELELTEEKARQKAALGAKKRALLR